MSDERLRELYAGTMARKPSAGAKHVSPEEIAALARREGDEADRLRTLDHVMSCAECRKELDLLRSVEQAGKREGTKSVKRSWIVPTALAASVVLAVGVGRTVLQSGRDDATRGDESAAVALLQPGPEAVAGDSIIFIWRPVPNARRYELELMDPAGNVAASAETADTTAAPPAARQLPAGDYRWWVRATTSDARALRSPLRPLRLTNR